jgi:hypothetical protein
MAWISPSRKMLPTDASRAAVRPQGTLARADAIAAFNLARS